MDADEVRERASDLPAEPGVYQFVEGGSAGDDGSGTADGGTDLRGGGGGDDAGSACGRTPNRAASASRGWSSARTAWRSR
jgi:hypothetical protein